MQIEAQGSMQLSMNFDLKLKQTPISNQFIDMLKDEDIKDVADNKVLNPRVLDWYLTSLEYELMRIQQVKQLKKKIKIFSPIDVNEYLNTPDKQPIEKFDIYFFLQQFEEEGLRLFDQYDYIIFPSTHFKTKLIVNLVIVNKNQIYQYTLTTNRQKNDSSPVDQILELITLQKSIFGKGYEVPKPQEPSLKPIIIYEDIQIMQTILEIIKGLLEITAAQADIKKFRNHIVMLMSAQISKVIMDIE